MVEAFSSWICK